MDPRTALFFATSSTFTGNTYGVDSSNNLDFKDFTAVGYNGFGRRKLGSVLLHELVHTP